MSPTSGPNRNTTCSPRARHRASPSPELSRNDLEPRGSDEASPPRLLGSVTVRPTRAADCCLPRRRRARVARPYMETLVWLRPAASAFAPPVLAGPSAAHGKPVVSTLGPGPEGKPRHAADPVLSGFVSVLLFCSGGWRWYQGPAAAGIRGAPLPGPASTPGGEVAMDGCEIGCHRRWRRRSCRRPRGCVPGAIRFQPTSPL